MEQIFTEHLLKGSRPGAQHPIFAELVSGTLAPSQLSTRHACLATCPHVHSVKWAW